MLVFCWRLVLVAAALLLVGAAEVRAEGWRRADLPAAASGRTLNDVFFLDAQNGWAVGDGALCLRTTDGGSTWSVVDVASKADFRRIRFNADGAGWICGDGDPGAPAAKGHIVLTRPNHASTLLTTADGGATWETHWAPTNFMLTGLVATAAPTVVLSTSGGSHADGDTLRSVDGGKARKLVRAHRALSDLCESAGGRLLACGSGVAVGFKPEPDAAIYHDKACRVIYSDDSGATWAPATGTAGRGWLRAIASGPGGVALAVGDGGAILRSEDDGATWRAVESGVTTDLLGVAIAGEIAIAVGKSGAALRSDDTGKTWRTIDVGATTDLRRVTAHDARFHIVGDQALMLTQTQ